MSNWLLYSLFSSYVVLDLRRLGDTRFYKFNWSNVKSVQFASKTVQCRINFIFANKFKLLTCEKYPNILHESYQINNKVYKNTKLNQNFRVTNMDQIGRKPRNSTYVDIRVTRIPGERTSTEQQSNGNGKSPFCDKHLIKINNK